jgi:biotin transport system substrate-specific component
MIITKTRSTLIPSYSIAADAILILLGSLLIAASAQLTLRLPFSPVPITGQTFAVLVVGALLGSRRGVLAVAAYLLEGAAGLPIFSGGTAGVAVLVGPTGGYLAGFAAAAWVVGKLAERGLDRSFGLAVLVFLGGTAVIYLAGVSWLATFLGWEKAVQAGLLPFVWGDLFKVILAALALPVGWKFLGKSV